LEEKERNSKEKEKKAVGKAVGPCMMAKKH
jgi:hypothetical protein